MCSIVRNTDVEQRSSQAVVVAVSSQAVFDSETEQDPGLPDLLKKGPAFSFIEAVQQVNKKLLDKNPAETLLFDVILLSNYSKDTNSKIIASVKHYGLAIGRFCFCNKDDNVESLQSSDAKLFLSTDRNDVFQASQQGVPSALLFHQQAWEQQASGQQASGQQASGQQAWGQQASGHQASGQQAWGQQASGQQASGQQASGHQASGQQAWGQQASGQQASGQQASGQQASGQQASGQQAWKELKVVFSGDALGFSQDDLSSLRGQGLTEPQLQSLKAAKDLVKEFAVQMGEMRSRFGLVGSPLRAGLVTVWGSRDVCARALLTLRGWGLLVDEVFCLAGAPPSPILRLLQPHVHCVDGLLLAPGGATLGGGRGGEMA
ncbi:cytosolic 5'-nucleotidase 1A [Osmerus mordax]|uniref:cytosolic 5'-nucleotidase 1A n=1 Tax=Osmerus mordax TaxID=8014 RepID=UPI00350EDC6B